MRTAIAITMAAALVLAGCDGSEHKDLKNELETMTKDLRGKVDPLPTVKRYEPVPYTSLDLVDPFTPSKIILPNEKSGTKTAGLQPPPDHVKEPLEAFPLETIKMVGTLTKLKNVFALVKADQGLYRVRVGNYLGQNYGVITKITENEITLRELIQESGDEWTERTSSLLLQESESKK